MSAVNTPSFHPLCVKTTTPASEDDDENNVNVNSYTYQEQRGVTVSLSDQQMSCKRFDVNNRLTVNTWTHRLPDGRERTWTTLPQRGRGSIVLGPADGTSQPAAAIDRPQAVAVFQVPRDGSLVEGLQQSLPVVVTEDQTVESAVLYSETELLLLPYVHVIVKDSVINSLRIRGNNPRTSQLTLESSTHVVELHVTRLKLHLDRPMYGSSSPNLFYQYCQVLGSIVQYSVCKHCEIRTSYAMGCSFKACQFVRSLTIERSTCESCTFSAKNVVFRGASVSRNNLKSCGTRISVFPMISSIMSYDPSWENRRVSKAFLDHIPLDILSESVVYIPILGDGYQNASARCVVYRGIWEDDDEHHQDTGHDGWFYVVTPVFERGRPVRTERYVSSLFHTVVYSFDLILWSSNTHSWTHVPADTYYTSDHVLRVKANTVTVVSKNNVEAIAARHADRRCRKHLEQLHWM